MWITFALSSVALVAFLFTPGALCLVGSGMGMLTAISSAPLVSVFIYIALSIVTANVGIPANWVTVFFPALAISLIVLGLSRLKRRAGLHNDGDRGLSIYGRFVSTGKFDWLVFAAYLIVGITTVGIFFVKNLDGPSPIFQNFDNFQHLGSIQTLVATQRYTPFGGSLYDAAEGFEAPINVASFYPSAWYILGAMVVSATGVSVPLAANVVNTVFSAIVFPAGSYLMMRALFITNRRPLLCGIIICMSFGVFPWGFLVFGPLYPNLMSYAMLPSCMALFILLFYPEIEVGRRIAIGTLMLVGVSAIVISQPNAVFTAAVFLAPFCVDRAVCAARLPRFSHHRAIWGLLFGVLACGLIIGIWMLLYFAPPLQSVVQNNWAASYSRIQALWNVVTLHLTSRTSEQFLLAAFVIVGVIYALRHARFRWMVASYLFATITYFVSTTSEGTLKHILAGFWYTDSFRLAANIAICGIPLAALGMWCSFALLCRCFSAIGSRLRKNGEPMHSARVIGATSLFASVAVILYLPSVALPGQGPVTRAFGEVSSWVIKSYPTRGVNVLDDAEIEFSKKALSLIPEGSLILNEPNDGTAFLYPLLNANLYYRYATGYGGDNETEDSRLIRTGLSAISIDTDVREAIQELGARYVLILDMGGEWTEDRHFLPESYDMEQWVGFNSITDETPGFKVLLAEGDMRLYEILL